MSDGNIFFFLLNYIFYGNKNGKSARTILKNIKIWSGKNDDPDPNTKYNGSISLDLEIWIFERTRFLFLSADLSVNYNMLPTYIFIMFTSDISFWTFLYDKPWMLLKFVLVRYKVPRILFNHNTHWKRINDTSYNIFELKILPVSVPYLQFSKGIYCAIRSIRLGLF